MNIRNLTAMAILMSCFTAASIAQEIEYDDMYFNSKDRELLNARKASAAYAYNENKNKAKDAEKADEGNPTDSYSSRNVNPEYVSRSKGKASKNNDEGDYFVNDYRYQSGNYYDNWNSGYNNWANDAWYSNRWSMAPYGSWYSPYYAHNAWANPWCDPFYSSFYSPYYSYGWPGSYTYYYGSSWGYNGFGWGMSYAWGNPYRGYWSPYWGGRNTVIIINNDDNSRKVTYGKRSPRGGSYVLPKSNSTRVRNTPPEATIDNGSRYSNGRTTDNSRNTDGWRRSTNGSAATPVRSSSGNSGYNRSSNNSSSGWNNSGNRSSSWGNSGSNSSSGSFQRSSSGSSSSPSYTPSRSSGSSGGGTNGRSRGGR